MATLQTDTEVITYIVDYLHRRLGLTLQETAKVICTVLADYRIYERRRKEQNMSIFGSAFWSLLVTGPLSPSF